MLILCCSCSKQFNKKPSQVKRAKFNYCSIKCRNKHYKITRLGEFNPAWKGGKLIRKDGYIEIYTPWHPFNHKGYVLEHRLVMEKYLGRHLKAKEIVHHKDHNPSNNNLDNLILLNSQNLHASTHMKELVKTRERDREGRFI